MIVISTSSLCVSLLHPSTINPLRIFVLDASSALAPRVSSFFEFVPFIANAYKNVTQHTRIIQDLTDENKALRQWEVQARLLTLENTRLRAQLRLASRTPSVSQTLHVLGQVRDTTQDKLLLAGGIQNGVQEGDAVVLGNILVGQVAACGDKSAFVRTIRDPHARIPVVGEKSGSHGVVGGAGSWNLTLIHNQDTRRFEDGELLLTTHDGAVFPPDLVVGRAVKDKQGRLIFIAEAPIRAPAFVSVLPAQNDAHHG